MERWHSKVIVLVLTFIIPFGCTILPIKVSTLVSRWGKRGERILGNLMCFGGGVFFGTMMLHMGPEARLLVHETINAPNHLMYPVSDLVASFGFFLVLIVEQLVVTCAHPRKPHDLEDAEGKSGHNGNSEEKSPTEVELMFTEDKPTNGDCQDKSSHSGSLHADLNHEELILQDAHSRRAMILIIALSFHRIFEGVSIGLQKSPAALWNLFGAVMCHETVIGFSLGLQFVRNHWTPKRTAIAALCCSLVMPLGVGLGALMIELSRENRTILMVNGLLQSCATGTFIYVTFFEILGHELMSNNASKVKVLCVLLGFAIMAALSAIPGKRPVDAVIEELLEMNNGTELYTVQPFV